jgi:NAD(P)-dependent dehydrogenase (short-subunit alcohol dehydrogenase family)
MEPTTAAMEGMEGKVCLVTGATSGIGLVTARELARQGARVVLVGRSHEKLDAVLQQIRAETGSQQKAEALLADLSCQEQVRDLARQFQERHQRLDVLVNNAGGMWLKRELTTDGIERTFAVNHLAYFLLTNLLLDVLKASAASAPARVVNVSSAAHKRATLDFDNLQGERSYGGWRQYCRSKLMNLLFTYELARRLEGTAVTANALHPGFVATGFAGNNGWRGRLIQLAARLFGLSVEQGARTIVYLASSPEVAGVSGRYFVRERAVDSSSASYDQAAAKRLWQLSAAMTGLEKPSPELFIAI